MSLSIFGYRISDYGVEIILLGFSVRRIPFFNIEDISVGSSGWAGEIWTAFKVWGLVTIKKKKGLLKYVTIAPKNPEDFVLKVKEKMQD
ncbi:MAG: hypothetical protein DDT31_01523 [Syntrophomonadaceae bacterium]|nr:hypothetical protein [Bacillota bacterium]MBT9149435.1 hypothetical protein [Chloroflexota bacterium]